MWQDLVLMAGGFTFSIALLPSVIKEVKMPLATPLITAAVLTLFAGVYATLGLWLGCVANGITAALWWYLVTVAVSK